MLLYTYLNKMKKILIISLLSVCMAFAVNADNNDPTNIKDCSQGFNRASFSFNQGLDKAILRPIALGYRKLPNGVRTITSNFLNNLSNLVTIPNNALQGDLRKAITALQVAAALDKKISRSLIYETSATAPPESLHQYLMSCRQDGFHAARRRLRELLDRYGLAGTDFVNQLHRELYGADFLSEMQKLDLTELMAEIDFRLVEGGGEAIQLDALTARLSQLLS